jgi:peptidyl-prolyl cis-trans isomerase-like 4
MSVLLETSLGDLVIDLFYEQCPKTCFNFLGLCMLKRLNDRLISSVQKDYLFKVTANDDTSVFSDKYFVDEISKRKFNKRGIVAMANEGPDLNASNFFITLTDENLDHAFYKKHTIFG